MPQTARTFAAHLLQASAHVAQAQSIETNPAKDRAHDAGLVVHDLEARHATALTTADVAMPKRCSGQCADRARAGGMPTSAPRALENLGPLVFGNDALAEPGDRKPYLVNGEKGRRKGRLNLFSVRCWRLRKNKPEASGVRRETGARSPKQGNRSLSSEAILPAAQLSDPDSSRTRGCRHRLNRRVFPAVAEDRVLLSREQQNGHFDR